MKADFDIGDIIEPKDATVRHLSKRLITGVQELTDIVYYRYYCLVRGIYDEASMSSRSWSKVA